MMSGIMGVQAFKISPNLVTGDSTKHLLLLRLPSGSNNFKKIYVFCEQKNGSQHIRSDEVKILL